MPVVRLLFMALFGAAASACAPIADAGSPTVSQPEWLRRATPQEIMRAVDAHVRGVGFVGHAVLRCTVAPDGRLTACAVASESHPGLGLAQAALSLAPYFQVDPRAGRRWIGRTVEVPVRMPAPAP
jgi:TonB family protein